jgi:hypothetical protein
MVIHPVPDYALKTFHNDPRFSDDWREKEQAAIAQANREIIRAASAIAINPLNHAAVILIRRFYPAYEPELDLIADPPKRVETWWERLSKRPALEGAVNG